MEINEAQQKELENRYEKRFEEKGDTLTFQDMFEVRHAYFNELREQSKVVAPTATKTIASAE